MSTTTPYLGLTLYDATTDQVVTFATFRAVWGGTAVTSNFYKIDTSASSFNSRITSLESNRGAIPVPAAYISANFYTATGISGITAYNTGMTIILSLDTTSDGTVTLDINTLGTKSVMKVNRSGTPINLTGADLLDGRQYMFIYDGTRWLWVGQTPEDDGWISDGNTWTYSSVDGATGIMSVNSDMTTTVQKGMRLGYTQLQALTAYWTFNTNSNSDVGSFNGTDTSMTYTAGKFSNAATFNGTTSKIVLTDTALLKPTGDFTFGMWFKTSNTGAIKTLFQSYSDNTNANGIKIEVSASNVITVGIGNNLASDTSTVTGTTTVTGGTDFYLVVTVRNNYLQVYLNGNLESSGYCVAPSYAGTNYVRVGCGNITGTDITFMNGQIDDLFLINGYALDEITIYNKYVANTAQGTGSVTVNKTALITNVGVYSGGNTLVTSWGGTDYSLANATISLPKYSNEKVPFGFQSNPDKWSVLLTDSTTAIKNSPSATTWYNLGVDGGTVALSIVAPIGQWRVYYKAVGELIFTTVATVSVAQRVTLSTSTSAESNALFTTTQGISAPIITGGICRLEFQLSNKILNLTAKTTYYLLGLTGANMTSISFRGDLATTTIKLECVYL